MLWLRHLSRDCAYIEAEHGEFLQALRQAARSMGQLRWPCYSLQARASIAAALGVSAHAAHARLTALFERLAAARSTTERACGAGRQHGGRCAARGRPRVCAPLPQPPRSWYNAAAKWGAPAISVHCRPYETRYPEHEAAAAAAAVAAPLLGAGGRPWHRAPA